MNTTNRMTVALGMYVERILQVKRHMQASSNHPITDTVVRYAGGRELKKRSTEYL